MCVCCELLLRAVSNLIYVHLLRGNQSLLYMPVNVRFVNVPNITFSRNYCIGESGANSFVFFLLLFVADLCRFSVIAIVPIYKHQVLKHFQTLLNRRNILNCIQLKNVFFFSLKVHFYI